jgi:hypothetical protein
MRLPQIVILTYNPSTLPWSCDRDKPDRAKTEIFMNTSASPLDAFEGDDGCAYILGESASNRMCGAPRRPESSYCEQHHALCHLVCGSPAEANRLREVEAIASAVGGRRARNRGGPSKQFLRRIEHAALTSS